MIRHPIRSVSGPRPRPSRDVRFLALLSIALLGACAPPRQQNDLPASVKLEVEPGEVAGGDSITLRLDNSSAAPIGFNLCSSEMERRVADEWQQLPSDRICTRELRIIAAGEEARYRLQIPAGLAPGEYRFHTSVEMQDRGASESVRSEPFRVRG